MCEWLKQAVLKTAVPERVPGVRIPLPPPRSLDCREIQLALRPNTRIMPVFRDYSQTNRTAENGLLGIECSRCPGFSLEGTCAVRFQGARKAKAMRSKAGTKEASGRRTAMKTTNANWDYSRLRLQPSSRINAGAVKMLVKDKRLRRSLLIIRVSLGPSPANR